jgi:hypothetical protein
MTPLGVRGEPLGPEYVFNEGIPAKRSFSEASCESCFGLGAIYTETPTRRSPSGLWRLINPESSFDNCSPEE